MRYHYLDSIRAFLMSLGFIFHASMILSSPDWFGNIQGRQSVFSFVLTVLHSFRMQGFFLIAGFFSIMAIKKYGNKDFLTKRLVRLGVPLFFVGFTFNTAMILVLQSNKNGNAISFIFSRKYFLGGGFLSQLWFLPTLILFCFALFLISKYFPALISRCREYQFGFFRIYCLLMLMASGFAALVKYFPKSPYGNWFIFNARSCGYYFPFFILGVIFFLNQKTFDNYCRQLPGNICILVLAVVLSVVAETLPYSKYVKHLLQFPIALSINGILFKFMNKFLNDDNKICRSISDASYTMYLLHLPALAIIAFYLVKTTLNNCCQFIILVLSTWLMTYFFHMKIIRRIPILSFLFNGQSPKKLV